MTDLTRPTHDVYMVAKDGKRVRVGVAFALEDGSTQLELAAIPTDGRLVLTPSPQEAPEPRHHTITVEVIPATRKRPPYIAVKVDGVPAQARQRVSNGIADALSEALVEWELDDWL